MTDTAKIPQALKDCGNWILWKIVDGKDGKPKKIPLQINGFAGSSTNPEMWSTFDEAVAASKKISCKGLGFVFSPDDPFCGIDLDGCRHAQTGKVEEWAREIIFAVNTYTEVSPSLTGVKMFLIGQSPFTGGKKLDLPDMPRPVEGGKTPAIEIYDRGRYFAVTGLRLGGVSFDPQERDIGWLKEKFWPDDTPIVHADFHSHGAVIERARKYLLKLPPAVSGSSGHNATFHAACVLVMGFGLDESEAISLMQEYNAICSPPWSDRELLHKVRQAAKQSGERNYLRNAKQDRWSQIKVPGYHEPAATAPETKVTTLATAAKGYVEQIKAGKVELIETGLPDVDYAIGGGVERGEMVILAALPSHGKSLCALQCVHHWTANNRPCVIISEEMSARMLGKRTLQFASDLPEEHWTHQAAQLEKDADLYHEQHSTCVIVESCGSSERAVEEIAKAVEEHKVQCAIVDYAQLLNSPGKSRYEQVSNTSIALRHAASKYGIVLVALCQLNRELVKRTKLTPTLGDIRDSGQLGQDADVILFLVWPHRMDASHPAEGYQIHVAKNRNRAINSPLVNCRLQPSRQRLLISKVERAEVDVDEYSDYFK